MSALHQIPRRTKTLPPLRVGIGGPVGSGKTTLLNAISQYIEDDERVVTIEDAAELKLQQPNLVRLETKPVTFDRRREEEVTIRDLVKNALRMRPDRIIVGEVRGAEAFDMMQAMNTGHDGSMGAYANPALMTASVATMSPAERSSATPTNDPGGNPSVSNRDARAFAHESIWAYVKLRVPS